MLEDVDWVMSISSEWTFMYLLISLIADIDDMHICYVLRNGDNATSDIFHFSIEDNGKSFSFPPRWYLFMLAEFEGQGLYMM